MIVFLEPLKKLREKGWTQTRLQKEKMISNGTIARLRRGLSVSTDTIDTICRLCDCQPCDVIKYEEKGEA